VAGRWLPVLLFQTARPREELRRGRGDKAATLVAKENGCVFFLYFLLRLILGNAMFLAYQPPVSTTFLSEQTNYQQPASNTFLSKQISTSHQPNERAAVLLNVRNQNLVFIIE
jgi:hypothetical protein